MGETSIFIGLYLYITLNSVFLVWLKQYKPPEMQLEAFALVLAFQAGRSSAKLVPEGHLETEHMREITRMEWHHSFVLTWLRHWKQTQNLLGAIHVKHQDAFFFFFVSIGDPDPVLLKNTCSEANDVKTCGESDLHCRFERMVRFSVFFQNGSY